MAEIIIAKHRNGEVTDVPLRFIKDQAKFADADATVTSAIMPSSGGGYQREEQYDDFSSSSNNFPPMGGMSSAMGGGFGGGMMGGGEFDIAPSQPIKPQPRRDDEAPF
jgi:replicative DNA helicase